MTPPLLPEDDLEPAALDLAFREWGGVLVQLSSGTEFLDRMLSASRSFFSLLYEEKAALAIEGLPYFCGWSEMRNDRDWREQLHLGCERFAGGDRPAFRRLEGPNLWPDDVTWQGMVWRYVEATAGLGETILRRIARALHVGDTCFDHVAREGYLVAKLIAYHPQPSVGRVRSGVAAHVDFSWVTLTLQDSAGLEIRRPDGTWTSVAVKPGAVWVHPGELLEHATRGRYAATLHRVVNRSAVRTRVSVPVFVNPPLDAVVPVLTDLPAPVERPAREPCLESASEHVHRVLAPHGDREAFHFGAAEWHRKGRGGWCFACHPGTPADAEAA